MANLPPKDNNGLIVGNRAALVVDAGITPDVSAQIIRLSDELARRPTAVPGEHHLPR